MSKHPTERIRSVAEMQATSMQQSDKALRRMALAEERLARLEGRLAEKDEAIARHEDTISRLSEAVTALSAVAHELEAKLGKGVDQVFAGLEGRIKHLEGLSHGNPVLSVGQIRAEALDKVQHSDIANRIEDLERRASFAEVAPPLPAKPKRGRPKGSKNKPKAVALSAGGATQEEAKANLQAQVDKLKSESAENTPQDGVSSNPEASEG